MRRTIYLFSTRAPSEQIRPDTNYCSMSIISQNDSTPFVMVYYFYPMIIKIKLLIYVFKLRLTGAMEIEYRRKSIQMSPINKRETAPSRFLLTHSADRICRSQIPDPRRRVQVSKEVQSAESYGTVTPVQL